MSSIEIKKASIIALNTDAIVNAANESLRAGGGVCGAIFNAAGYEPLQAVCESIGHCATGSAVLTPGFHLKAKYIIHAVGPVWKGGKHDEPKLLYSAYEHALDLAVKVGCKSIGFPLISAGIYGYPIEPAWKKAIQACQDFLARGKQINIVFAVIDDQIQDMGVMMLRTLAPKPHIAVKSDWKTCEMPEQHASFLLERAFKPEQMTALRRGNIPKAMEDKWFWYMEGNTLLAHRSWTGACIYRIDFSSDDWHKVTVNRDPEQYTCTSIDEDKKSLNHLLDGWSREEYDYYGAWLAEPANTLKKAGLGD